MSNTIHIKKFEDINTVFTITPNDQPLTLPIGKGLYIYKENWSCNYAVKIKQFDDYWYLHISIRSGMDGAVTDGQSRPLIAELLEIQIDGIHRAAFTVHDPLYRSKGMPNLVSYYDAKLISPQGSIIKDVTFSRKASDQIYLATYLGACDWVKENDERELEIEKANLGYIALRGSITARKAWGSKLPPNCWK